MLLKRWTDDVSDNSKLQKPSVPVMIRLLINTGSLHVKFNQMNWLDLSFRLSLLKKKVFDSSYRTCHLC